MVAIRPLLESHQFRSHHTRGAGDRDLEYGWVLQRSPVVSPDNKKLVFAKNGDLWIRDLTTSAERRVTDVARPYDGEYSWVSIEIRGWSPRSDHLIYEVVRADRHGFDSCGWGDRPRPVIRDAAYGLYLYDLKSGAIRAVSIPGDLVAWISNDEVISTTKKHRFVSPFVRIKLGSTQEHPVPFPQDRDCGQLAPDPRGSFLLTSCARDLTSQLVELNLRDGQLRSVSSDGEYAERQWPTYSSTGRRIAWIRQTSRASGIPLGKLIVDSNEAFACHGSGSLIQYRWIDDDTVFCDCLSSLAVVDIPTGAVKGTVASDVPGR